MTRSRGEGQIIDIDNLEAIEARAFFTPAVGAAACQMGYGLGLALPSPGPACSSGRS